MTVVLTTPVVQTGGENKYIYRVDRNADLGINIYFRSGPNDNEPSVLPLNYSTYNGYTTDDDIITAAINNGDIPSGFGTLQVV